MQPRRFHDSAFGRSYGGPGDTGTQQQDQPPRIRGGGVLIAMLGALGGIGAAVCAHLLGASLAWSVVLYCLVSPMLTLLIGLMIHPWQGPASPPSFRPGPARTGRYSSGLPR